MMECDVIGWIIVGAMGGFTIGIVMSYFAHKWRDEKKKVKNL